MLYDYKLRMFAPALITLKVYHFLSFGCCKNNLAFSFSVLIPTPVRAQLALFVKRIASLVPELYAVDFDYPVAELCKDDVKVEQMLLGREFHISLGRTVPIQVHQIDSIVAMLRQKLLRKGSHRFSILKELNNRCLT